MHGLRKANKKNLQKASIEHAGGAKSTAMLTTASQAFWAVFTLAKVVHELPKPVSIFHCLLIFLFAPRCFSNSVNVWQNLIVTSSSQELICSNDCT